MRRMTKFVRGTAGSVSIFLLVIIFCFVALGGTLIDGIRVRTAKQRLELATEAAADSVLAEYSSKLANEYGILAYTGKEEKSTKRAKEVVEACASSVEDTYSMAILENIEVALGTGNILNPVVDSTVLEDQLLENSKYTGVYTLGKGMLEALGFFKEKINDIDSVQEVIANQEEITKLVNERNSALKEVEKQTNGIQNLKNKINNNAVNLGDDRLILWCVESCLVEVFIGSTELGDGPLKKNLDRLKKERNEYELAEDWDMVTKHNQMISVLEFVRDTIKATDETATNNLKSLLATFAAESKRTDVVVDALTEVLKQIEKAEEKNKAINDLIGRFKESELTEELRTSLGNIVMDDQGFTDMKQKITEVKEEYERYQVNVKTIERKLDNLVNGLAKIARPGIQYTHVGSADVYEGKTTEIEQSFLRDVNEAKGTLTTFFTTMLLGDAPSYNNAVSEGKGRDIEKLVEKIKAVNEWAKEKQYVEQPTQEVKDQEEALQSNADTSFTEIFNTLNKLEGLANDQGIYDELRSIVSTMQDISTSATKLNAKSMDEMYKQSGDLIGKIQAALASLGKRALVNEYLLNEVGSKQPKDLLEDITGNMAYKNKKVEFVMYGKYVSGANYALAMGEIILIRLLLNSVAAFGDDFVSIFKPYPLIYLAMILAYAVVNTAEDIITLGNNDNKARSKREVELVKNFTDKIPGIDGIKWTYKDHLRLMLLYHPRGGQYERLVAVMENDTDIQGVANKPTQVKIESSATVKLWFLPTITKSLLGGQGVKESPNELKLKSVKYASY